MDSEVFAKLPPTKLFFRCAVPSMITMVFGALYQIADGIFVGRFIGGDALAAVNIIMPIIMIVFSFSSMIATGASVNISILLGEKRQQDASQLFSFSLKVIFLLSCALGGLGFLFAEPFIRLLSPGASEAAIAYGVDYLRIYALFAPLLLIFFATDNYLRVCGKENLSMTVSIVTQVLNILLDIVLIAVLNQGIWAAAFTSCISMALGSVITLCAFRKKKMDLYYTKGNISSKTFFRVLANGSSEFFSSISMSVMALVHNVFLLTYGGTIAVSAMSVVFYVDSIVGMLTFGMCDALQPAISYCYGAGLFQRVKAIFRRVIWASVILSVVSLVFMLFCGRYVATFFVKPEDTELLALSIVAMQLFSFSYLFGWVDMIFSSYFTALDRPLRSLGVSMVGSLAAPISFLFILSHFWELTGIWLMPLVASTVSAAFTVLIAATTKLEYKR